MNVVMID